MVRLVKVIIKMKTRSNHSQSRIISHPSPLQSPNQSQTDHTPPLPPSHFVNLRTTGQIHHHHHHHHQTTSVALAPFPSLLAPSFFILACRVFLAFPLHLSISSLQSFILIYCISPLLFASKPFQIIIHHILHRHHHHSFLK